MLDRILTFLLISLLVCFYIWHLVHMEQIKELNNHLDILAKYTKTLEYRIDIITEKLLEK